MFVKIEDLEPKKIINFYLPQELDMTAKSLVLSHSAQVSHPLLSNLMSYDGIVKILLTDKLVSVHYDTEKKDDIRLFVLAELDDYFSDKVVQINEKTNVSEIEHIEALADAFIRPTLNRDKGDIDIISFTDGVLNIKLTGHCSGCPYAQNTLQNVIAKTFLRYFPQIREIKSEES